MRIRLLALAMLVALPPGSVLAHHGDAGRFHEEVTTLTGVVVALQLVNPHSIVIFDVEGDGGVVRWQAELGGPGRLAASFGWSRSTLAPGDVIRVTGRAVKSGAPFINLTENARIALLDGCEEIYRSRTPPGDVLNCTDR